MSEIPDNGKYQTIHLSQPPSDNYTYPIIKKIRIFPERKLKL
jgi:hypothetical protein